MDKRLIAWARAVKQRTRSGLPVLWLFTDFARHPDPLPAIARLPQGLCGVVFRHDAAPGRAALARLVAACCRRRGLALVIAGDPRLAWRVRAGVHLRGGRRAGLVRPPHGLVTSSVHDPAQLRLARRAGTRIYFISAAFASASHPGETPLGAVRWAALAARARPGTAYALGGVTGQKINELARNCRGAGAIHALSGPIS
jgi:thiamine-phosphate pyrophosphorylase